MDNTTDKTPKQLDFTQIQDPRPVPLIVAEKWDFPLQYHIVDNVCYFSIIDWIAGIGTSDNVNASKMWVYMQQNQTSIPTRTLNYKGKDSKNYQRDFANDVSLYDIAQNMRVTKDRPALKAIQDYLSQSGALLDFWRREPEKMLSAAQARMQFDIDRHEKHGLGDKPQIVHLKSEFEVSKSLKSMNEMIKRVVANPDYAKLHNAKLESLFGLKSAQIKALLKCKNIHEGLPVMGLDTLDLAHKHIIEILRMQSSGQIDNARAIASIELVVKPLGDYLRNLCNQLGIDHVSGLPLLPRGKDKE